MNEKPTVSLVKEDGEKKREIITCSPHCAKLISTLHDFLSLSAAGAASFVLKWPRRIADNSYPWETLKVRDEQGRWKGTLSVAQNPFSSQVEDGNRPRLVCHVLSARDLLYVRGSTKRRKRQMLFFPPLKFRPSLICECLRVFQFNLELWNNVTDLEDTFMC